MADDIWITEKKNKTGPINQFKRIRSMPKLYFPMLHTNKTPNLTLYYTAKQVPVEIPDLLALHENVDTLADIQVRLVGESQQLELVVYVVKYYLPCIIYKPKLCSNYIAEAQKICHIFNNFTCKFIYYKINISCGLR